MMYSKRFWSMIERARVAVRHWKDMCDPLLESLMALSVSEILSWGQILYKYLRLSNTGELHVAAAVITGSISSDGFEQFRCWLIAQGKDAFLRALKDADSLAELSYIQEFAAAEAKEAVHFFTTNYERFEEPLYGELLSIVPTAYKRKSGDQHNYYHCINSLTLSETVCTTIMNEIQYAPRMVRPWYEDISWDTSLAKMRKVIPRLCVLFDTS